MGRRSHLLMLVAILAGGAALRIYQLTDRSLWFDESASFALIDQFSWSEMMTRIKMDVHPPLFYVLFRAWAEAVGTSVAALRGFSVAWGMLTLAGVYLLCRDGFGKWTDQGLQANDSSRRTALLATALAAVSTPHISWSQETRMYSMGTALVVLSTWMLLRALSAQRPIAWWGGYLVIATAAAYTHYYTIFSLLAHGGFACGFVVWPHRRSPLNIFRSRTVWYVLFAFGGLLLAYAPWLPVLVRQTNMVRADFWIRPAGFGTIPNAWFRLFFPCAQCDPPSTAASLSWLAFLLSVLAVFLLRRDPMRWLLLLVVVVPVTIATMISLWMVSIIVTRYFLFAHVFALCILADVATRADFRLAKQWRRSRPIVGGLLLAGGLLVHVRYWNELDLPNRPGTRGAVAYVLEHRKRGEPIIVLHPGIYFNVKYYVRGIAEARLYYPHGMFKHYYGAPMLIPEDVIGSKDLPHRPGSRVWVVSTPGFSRGFEPFALPESWERVKDTRSWFPDAFEFQKAVFVGAYELSPHLPDEEDDVR